ncbi:MAG: NADH:ubiquinone reductase (Na(+)-transporting) subunit C [FCB group bacterium]|nr:NADH:ubiquinone reductase (Na(+)-transporting) subunit C [FCB group bacterium]
MRSNLYVLGFMSSITVILGILLSLAATSLKEKQDLNIQLDIKKNILRSLGIPEDRSQKLSPEEVQSLFDEKIKTIRVNEQGKEDPKGNLLVYIKMENGKPDGYAIPVSGKGLWSTIYGYLAIEPDGKTVRGITFYKHGETPGLGGEIEKEWFTSNFVGKQIVDAEGNTVGIHVVKGKVNPNDKNAVHEVDGISGATMTGKGVSRFLEKDIKMYGPFFQRIRAGIN